MRKILVAVALILGAFAGAIACKAAAQPTVVAGVATDHSHVVSFEQFKRVVAGHGESLDNLQLAYQDTTWVCTTVMTSRWQDRPSLLSVLPASIQDPIRRGQVYSAVLSTVTKTGPSACVA